MNKVIVSGLKNLHADNFVVYFKSHVFHFDVQGANFSQDHALLNEVYDFLLDMHDTLGEQIRQLDSLPCSSLKDMLEYSVIGESKDGDKSSKEMLGILSNDFDSLNGSAQALYESTTECGGLQTMLGDYLKDLSKIHWKIKATIGKSIK